MSTHRLYGAHGARFLDPENVGSSIRWGVTVDEHTSNKGKKSVSLDATVSLTDCSRVIHWSSYNDDLLLKKVQEAIAELKQAEKALKKAAALRAAYPDEET